jgi:7,8-dihydropterin-6-yl-methyl-4-(beta-D-ribofuranosyl)aminobenzene 5'-phosphate synthase
MTTLPGTTPAPPSPRLSPPDRVTITVLCENTSGRPWVMGEWGLSLWIEVGGRRILLDTGLEHALAHNAAELGVDLSTADALVLSHGHVDHVGGVGTALAARPGLPVHLHPDSLLQRFSRFDSIGLAPEDAKGVGTAPEIRALLEQRADLRFVTSPTEVAPFVWVTGEIPRVEPVEGTGGSGFLDEALSQPDLIPGDMALWIETQAGLLVVLGCAHSGVINTLRHIQKAAGDTPIAGILGGTHLLVAKPERMAATIAALRELPLRMLAPCHCTGPKETHQLRTAFPDLFTVMTAGTRLTFPPPAAA